MGYVILLWHSLSHIIILIIENKPRAALFDLSSVLWCGVQTDCRIDHCHHRTGHLNNIHIQLVNMILQNIKRGFKCEYFLCIKKNSLNKGLLPT